MPEITIKQRRRILMFADEVATMAAERAPDIVTRKELWGVVQSIRKRFGFTKEQKQIEIWKALQDGAHTISDIILVTKFHRDDIHEITKAFEVAGFVEFRKINITGGAGKPTVMISPLAKIVNFAPLKLNYSK
jgi:hypothetical protein